VSRFAPRRFGNTYRPAARDSARAIADATQLLCAPGVRLEDWTPERLAQRFNLSMKQAEYLLAVAQTRRAD
jgi:hypothetical protein